MGRLMARLADAPVARRIVTVRSAARRVRGAGRIDRTWSEGGGARRLVVFSARFLERFAEEYSAKFSAKFSAKCAAAMSAVTFAIATCGVAQAAAMPAPASAAKSAAAPASVTASATATSAPEIVVLGDSLSAEYGLRRDSGWVALMRQRLAKEHLDYSVANASISGDTTSGGRARLPVLMQRLKPAILIVELGANDALRGVPLDTTEANLRAIIESAQQGHAKVMLIGMYVPPNFGPDYTQKFHAVYSQLAQQYKLPLVPFLLAGIENNMSLFQSDQIHPNEQAQSALLNNVWPTLKPLLATSGKPGQAR
jgi:acyl-CoA thioesterase I